MSVGGELYVACDGEDELGADYQGPMADGVTRPCALTSGGRDVGFYPDARACESAELEMVVSEGWKVVSREKPLHLCPECWKTWNEKHNAQGTVPSK